MDIEHDDTRLTLAEMILRLGRDGGEKKTRSTLARYLAEDGVGPLLGASGPVRPTFPQNSLPMFGALLDANERGETTPKRGADWLARTFPAVAMGGPDARSPDKRISDYPVNSLSGIPTAQVVSAEVVERGLGQIAEFVEAVRALSAAVPVREDRLLTRTQAAELLACAPGTVRRRVAPMRRGVWRWSDVMCYIASL